MIDPHRLTVFRSVHASGSIQAAASHLGYTPSAVSQHIAALQRETGLTLFERSGRGIVATSAAHSLAAHTDDVMRRLGELDDVVAALRQGRTGHLTIGYFASAGSTWVPLLVKAVRAELPQVSVQLVLTEQPSEVVPDLDLVLMNRSDPDPPGFKRTHLTRDPYVALLPATHPLAGRDRIALTDLVGETFVSNGPLTDLCSRLVASACEASGFTVRYAVQAQDHYTAMAFVAAEVGVTILPELATHDLPAGVRRVELAEPRPVRDIAALRRLSAVPNRAADRALELLLDLLRERPEAADQQA